MRLQRRVNVEEDVAVTGPKEGIVLNCMGQLGLRMKGRGGALSQCRDHVPVSFARCRRRFPLRNGRSKRRRIETEAVRQEEEDDDGGAATIIHSLAVQVGHIRPNE